MSNKTHAAAPAKARSTGRSPAGAPARHAIDRDSEHAAPDNCALNSTQVKPLAFSWHDRALRSDRWLYQRGVDCRISIHSTTRCDSSSTADNGTGAPACALSWAMAVRSSNAVASRSRRISLRAGERSPSSCPTRNTTSQSTVFRARDARRGARFPWRSREAAESCRSRRAGRPLWACRTRRWSLHLVR